MVIIIYFILLAKGWEFVAVDNKPSTLYYYEVLQKELVSKFEGKMGNMKVICAPYDGREI